MTQEEIMNAINAQNSIILDRKAKLNDTDYVVIRHDEQGTEISEEFKAQRQNWRDEINAAQEEIKRLEALEPEEPERPIEE